MPLSHVRNKREFQIRLQGAPPAVVILAWQLGFDVPREVFAAGRSRWPEARWCVFVETHHQGCEELALWVRERPSCSMVHGSEELLTRLRQLIRDERVRREERRLEVLHSLKILATPVEETFDRLTRVACAALKAPAGMVALVDRERLWVMSARGIPRDPLQCSSPMTKSLCARVVAQATPIAVADIRDHPEGAPLVKLGLTAYLGVPLVWDGGWVLGSLCVGDRVSRIWQAEEEQLLVDLAAAVLTELRLLARAEGNFQRSAAAQIASLGHWDEVPFGVVLVERQDRTIHYVNPVLARWAGRERPAILGCQIEQLHGAEEGQRLKAAISGLAIESRPLPIEVSFVTPGHTQFADAMVSAAAPGRSDLAAVYYVDASKRRAVDRRWRKLSDTVFQSRGGPGFFGSLLEGLVRGLDVDMATLAVVEGNPPQTWRSLAICERGGAVAAAELPLAGLPAEELLQHRFLAVTAGFRRRFPLAAWHHAAQVESYFGIPLTSPDGQVIGLLEVMHRAPVRKSRDVRAAMQVVAVRAALELGRIRLEKSLQEGRVASDLVRAVNQQLSVLIAYVGADGRCRMVNQRWEQQFGQRRADIEGRFMREVLGTDELAQVGPPFDRALSGETAECELIINRRQGARPAVWRMLMVPDRRDELVEGVFLLAVDTPAEQRSDASRSRAVTALSGREPADEDAVQRSHRHLPQLLRAARIAVWSWDAATNRLQISETAALMGLFPLRSPSTIEELQSQVHPQDRTTVAKALTRAIRDDVHGSPEFRIVGANGEMRWITTRGVTERDAGGQARRLVGLAMDITAERSAAAELERTIAILRGTLEATTDGLLVVDNDRRFVTCNDRFAAIWV